jgi:hypothetical protein
MLHELPQLVKKHGRIISQKQPPITSYPSQLTIHTNLSFIITLTAFNSMCETRNKHTYQCTYGVAYIKEVHTRLYPKVLDILAPIT